MRLRHNTFLKAAGMLVGATAIAQLLGLAILPLLTRLFSAEDFSALAIYAAILTLLGSVICMRFDAAIPLPENEDEAQNLLILAILSTAVITFAIVIIILLFGKSLAELAGKPELARYMWLIPVGTSFVGLYSAFQFMAVRRKAFNLIARARLMQAISGLGTQLVLGLTGVGAVGLIIGHTILSGVGVVALGLQAQQKNNVRSTLPTRSMLAVTAVKYRRFPQYSVLEELTNSAGVQISILLIGTFLIGPEAGYLFLAMRVVGAPLSIIGGAVSQVYYSDAAQYERDGILADETIRIFKRMSTWLVLPMVTLGPFAPSFFKFVFGEEWERAGALLVWMLPWYAFQCVASPISMVMHVKMKQSLLLLLTTFGMIVRIIPLLFAIYQFPEYAVYILAVTSATFYGVISIIFLVVSGLAAGLVASLILKLILKCGAAMIGSFIIVKLIQ